ncbi:MAG: EamA family transporter RarD [Planctomycetota bacterium]
MPSAPDNPDQPTQAGEHALPKAGLAFAFGAYIWWGVAFPVFLRLLKDASAMELLALRVLTGLPVLAALLTITGGWAALSRLVRDRRSMGVLVLTTALIAANWYAFTYSVVAGKLLEASLGYYINPLVSVALGMVFLGERLRAAQWVAVGIAAASVAWLTWSVGSLPIIAVTVAITFGLYGLLRKQSKADPIGGLTVEMALCAPVMLGLMVWLGAGERALLLSGTPGQIGLLLLCGAMTVLPLTMFAAAAKRLRLSTIGIIQYIAPTGQFLSALAFGEAFDKARAIAFAAIWVALILFTADSLMHHRNSQRRQRRDAAARVTEMVE